MSKEKFLALDAGNSNIVMGLFLGDELCHQWRIHTDRKKLTDEYSDMVDSLLQKIDIKPEDIDIIGISNVVPSLGQVFENLSREHFKIEPFFVNISNQLNFQVSIDNPRELGADLIAAAASAVEKYKTPCIIIDFGTATTITAINGQGQFLGGAIAPGLAVSSEALYSRAPHLPRIRLKPPPSVIGANTVHAMQAGMFTGYGHLVRGLVRDMKTLLDSPAKVVATGGLAEIFREEPDLLDALDPCLVLDGIRILHRLNCR